MTTQQTNIYAKVNCYSDYRREMSYVTAKNYLAHDFYTSLYKFLQTLSASNMVDLIAMYSGSNGNGVGYWDEATAFGSGSFSVWKMKANGERTWDWYLYIHTNAGSTGSSFQETQNQIPTRLFGNTGDATQYRTVGYQAAINVSTSLTGSTSNNPWSGTLNTSGAAYKNTSVWISGPLNSYVFPRQNNISGSATTAKDNIAPFIRIFDGINELAASWHFFYDGNSLLSVRELLNGNTREPKRMAVSYIGTFRLNGGITSSNQGNVLSGTGSLGFMTFNSFDFVNTPTTTASIPENTVIGQLAYVTASFDGGALATLNQGVRTFLLSTDTPTYYITRSVFTNDTIDDRQLSVYMSGETGFFGFVGKIDSPLIRVAAGLTTHESTTNRAVWNSNTSPNGKCLITPWPTSSLSPGYTPNGLARNRDGFSYIINNYSI